MVSGRDGGGSSGDGGKHHMEVEVMLEVEIVEVVKVEVILMMEEKGNERKYPVCDTVTKKKKSQDLWVK